MTRATYLMPAEWEPQQAIWLAWPHQKKDWPGKFAPIPLVYCEIIRHIAATQKVRLLVMNQAMQEQAARMLQQAHANLDHVEFFQIPTNRVWVRDSGPIFVRDAKGQQIALDWKFNAWAKYPNWRQDNRVPERICELAGYSRLPVTYNNKPVVLEGGSIDVNGKGALLTTKECLLDPQIQTRNPGFSATDYEAVFQQYLGIDQVIWLEHGIVGDDTHGHVDDISRFISPHQVITAVETNRQDDNFAILQTNKRILEKTTLNNGQALEVIELPMPHALYYDGTRIPASYANFLICNKVVLVPTFNDANDAAALNILAQCFPKRQVVGIHAVDLVWGFGTLHCLSQQQPAA